jgi:hypothetical protein
MRAGAGRFDRRSRDARSHCASCSAGAGRLLLVLLSALPVLLAMVFRAAGQPADVDDFTRRIFDTITMTILLPLVAILFGSGAFGAEIDDGTSSTCWPSRSRAGSWSGQGSSARPAWRSC